MDDRTLLKQIFYDYVAVDELERANEIEKLAYHPDEAGTLEAFIQRQKIPGLFLGAYLPSRNLVGYVNATLAKSESFTVESMHHHDPEGSSVCIHGIAILEPYRNRGLGTALLKEYIRRLQDDFHAGLSQATQILLLCHEPLVGFYTRAGFSRIGNSSVVWGPDPWIEMQLKLDSNLHQTTALDQNMSDGILRALANNSRDRPSSRTYSSFSDPGSLVSPSRSNICDIVCPREGCGSLILKAGNAKFLRAPSFELEPADHTPTAPLERLPPPPSEINWWVVTPSVFTFENIAFSKPIPSVDTERPKSKLLACAECDLGAFGLSFQGSTEFLIAASRVGYR